MRGSYDSAIFSPYNNSNNNNNNNHKPMQKWRHFTLPANSFNVFQQSVTSGANESPHQWIMNRRISEEKLSILWRHSNLCGGQ